MIESLHVKKPIYPLLSIVVAILILVEGLLLAKSIRILYFLLAVSLVYLFFGYGKVFVRCIFIFAPISMFVGAISGLTAGSQVVALQTFGRTMLMALSAIPLISTPPIALTRNLTMLKCPRVITLGMLVTVRFVPILISESKQIFEAMKTRGVNAKWYNFSCIYRSFLIPFIMRMINMSDTMSLSMETRGFDLVGKDASVYKDVHFTVRDGIYALLMVIIMVGVLFLSK